MNKLDLNALAKQMCVIRRVEEQLLNLFSKGMLRGTVHTCIGQEACAVGVINALNKNKDILFSNHRGHGHYISYTGDIYGLIAEIMGRDDGVCKGIGGSQHLHKDNYYSNGIQGAGMPIAAGMALARKIRDDDSVSVAFIGDGTFGEGIVYETLNIASLWELPMLIVVEHNKYAQSTPTHEQHAGEFENRAKAFNIDVMTINGMNVKSVYENAEYIIESIRNNNKPYMIILDTYRFAPHSKGDDTRSIKEIELHRKYDPIDMLADELGHEMLDNIKNEAYSEVDKIVASLSTMENNDISRTS